jgi:hypothetical protein
MPVEQVVWHAARAIKAKRSQIICEEKIKLTTSKKITSSTNTQTHTNKPSKPQPIKNKKEGVKKRITTKSPFQSKKK